ncbi:MAG: hypothetical protein H7Y43_10055 [Akkermansiaceae bacterium]|nr:hypothetical protein [Verrucomicrobiales bacterium]
MRKVEQGNCGLANQRLQPLGHLSNRPRAQLALILHGALVAIAKLDWHSLFSGQVERRRQRGAGVFKPVQLSPACRENARNRFILHHHRFRLNLIIAVETRLSPVRANNDRAEMLF